MGHWSAASPLIRERSDSTIDNYRIIVSSALHAIVQSSMESSFETVTVGEGFVANERAQGTLNKSLSSPSSRLNILISGLCSSHYFHSFLDY